MQLLTIQAPDDFKVVTVPNIAVIGDKLNLGPIGAALVVTTNAVTITASYHQLQATGTAAQRSLRVINGGVEGDILVLRKDSTSPGDVIIDDNAVGGNIQSAGDFTLTNEKDMIAFIFDGTSWCELSRSNNA